LRDLFFDRQSTHRPAKFTWPLCAACASGTYGKTSSSPSARNASSCSSSWCSSGSYTRHTAR